MNPPTFCPGKPSTPGNPLFPGAPCSTPNSTNIQLETYKTRFQNHKNHCHIIDHRKKCSKCIQYQICQNMLNRYKNIHLVYRIHQPFTENIHQKQGCTSIPATRGGQHMQAPRSSPNHELIRSSEGCRQGVRNQGESTLGPRLG